MSKRFSDLDQRRRELLLGGGAEKIEKQHRQGKLTARERLGLLPREERLPPSTDLERRFQPIVRDQTGQYRLEILDRPFPGIGLDMAFRKVRKTWPHSPLPE